MTRTSRFCDLDELDRNAWLALMERTPGCAVDLHPEILGWSLPEGTAPVMYADPDGAGGLQSLAALAPHPVHPLRHRRLRWLGRLRGLRVIGNGLVGQEDGATLRRFLDAASDLLARGHAECLYFEDVEEGSPLWNALAEREGEVRLLHPVAAQPHWQIRFPDPPEAYWQHFSAKSRNTLRRKARRFAHTIEAVTAPEQVPRFLAVAQHISASSWQGKRLGVRITDDARQRALLEALARLGALRSYVLYHEEAPVAFIHGWQWNGRYQYEETGYDLTFAEHGPGQILLYRLIEDLIARRCPTTFDFSFGNGEHKRRFGNRESRSIPVLALARTPRARLFAATLRARHAADRSARRLLHGTGLYQHARRLYRR